MLMSWGKQAPKKVQLASASHEPTDRTGAAHTSQNDEVNILKGVIPFFFGERLDPDSPCRQGKRGVR